MHMVLIESDVRDFYIISIFDSLEIQDKLGSKGGVIELEYGPEGFGS